MRPELEKAMLEISLRMRLIRAIQEGAANSEDLTERDILLLELLYQKGKMNVLQISAAFPKVSDATISTTLTNLWRNKKLVSKTVNPNDQRITIIELTDKGKKAVETVQKQRAERLKTFFRAIELTEQEQEVLLTIFNRAVAFFDNKTGPETNGLTE
jgi:DNA-binding MarR family transcriptional regulator